MNGDGAGSERGGILVGKTVASGLAIVGSTNGFGVLVAFGFLVGLGAFVGFIFFCSRSIFFISFGSVIGVGVGGRTWSRYLGGTSLMLSTNIILPAESMYLNRCARQSEVSRIMIETLSIF